MFQISLIQTHLFEYADVNNVSIDDAFLSLSVAELIWTCIMRRLESHIVPSSGREIEPDFPSSLDIQPKIDEFRIVGQLEKSESAASKQAMEAHHTVVTVTTYETFANLAVDTAVQINGHCDGMMVNSLSVKL